MRRLTACTAAWEARWPEEGRCRQLAVADRSRRRATRHDLRIPSLVSGRFSIPDLIQDLQRLQIRIGSDAAPTLSLDSFITIFGRWRKQEGHPAEWVDMADYAHVSQGPGIMLIGQRCNFSFDMGGPGPGILYAAKKGLTGSHPARILSAIEWCLALSNLLVAEEEFPPGVRLRTDSLELRFNDRLETPNTAATDEQLQPAIRQALDALFGQGDYRLVPQTDRNQMCGFSVQASKAEPLSALLDRLSQASDS